jgi:hypothetical protein
MTSVGPSGPAQQEGECRYCQQVCPLTRFGRVDSHTRVLDGRVMSCSGAFLFPREHVRSVAGMSHQTTSGTAITESDIYVLAREAEHGYDLDSLVSRHPDEGHSP